MGSRQRLRAIPPRAQRTGFPATSMSYRFWCTGLFCAALAISGCSHSPTVPVHLSDQAKKAALAAQAAAAAAHKAPPRLLVLNFVATDQKVFSFLPELAGAPGAQAQRLQHDFLDTRIGRATVLGAGWLSSDLQQYPGWVVLDRLPWETQLSQLANRNDLMQLIQGAQPDVLIVSTVEDVGVRESNFTGYGIDTSSRRYDLHIFVRAVDAHHFTVLASGEYGAESSTGASDHGRARDSGRIRDLMRQATAAAAQDLIAKLGPPNPQAHP